MSFDTWNGPRTTTNPSSISSAMGNKAATKALKESTLGMCPMLIGSYDTILINESAFIRACLKTQLECVRDSHFDSKITSISRDYCRNKCPIKSQVEAGKILDIPDGFSFINLDDYCAKNKTFSRQTIPKGRLGVRKESGNNSPPSMGVHRDSAKKKRLALLQQTFCSLYSKGSDDLGPETFQESEAQLGFEEGLPMVKEYMEGRSVQD